MPDLGATGTFIPDQSFGQSLLIGGFIQVSATHRILVTLGSCVNPIPLTHALWAESHCFGQKPTALGTQFHPECQSAPGWGVSGLGGCTIPGVSRGRHWQSGGSPEGQINT